MEETPQFPAAEDDDKDKDGATSKKKAGSLAELFKFDEAKNKADQDIGALFGLKKESDPKTDELSLDASVTDTKRAEQGDLEPTTLDEESYIYTRIADKHLEYPVTEGNPLPPVTDYLGLVHAGQPPGPAYMDVIRDNELSKKADTTNEDDASLVLGAAENIQEYTLPPPATYSPPRAEAPNSESASRRPNKELKTGISASEIAAYVVGQRRGSKQTKEKLAQKQKKLEQKIVSMESVMAAQEQSLQNLSREKRARDRVVAPAERTQPGRSESRIGMSKPERAERIGKVLIDNEKAPSSASKRRGFSPEQIKTMRRTDLLALSEKITVEGASLKHMFDNNLFGEGALRRLVEAYLDGRDMQPLLRREIMEKQIDYERDPLFRDRDHTLSKADSNIFERILQGAAQPKDQPARNSGEKLNAPKQQTSKPLKNVGQYSRSSVGGTILALSIVVLIGLILYVIFQ